MLEKINVFIIYEFFKGYEISLVCEFCVKNVVVRKIFKG